MTSARRVKPTTSDPAREVTERRSPDFFKPANQEDLQKFLAKQLLRGRLSMVLGAGVSVGCGLPNWFTLTQRAYDTVGAGKLSAGCDCAAAADELLKTHCGGDDIQFAELIRRVLYDGFSLDAVSLAAQPLLNALGALTMASARGNVSVVVSYNFDDLLERYLTYYGYSVNSIGKLPAWNSRADVKIMHPHGLLPSDMDKPVEGGIVMAHSQFQRIVGSAVHAWNRHQLDVMTCNTCLFIGLSGEDPNLIDLLSKVNNGEHASSQGLEKYWGIRFSDKDSDTFTTKWEENSVSHYKLPRYEDLPDFLLAICQKASVLSEAPMEIPEHD